MVEKGYVSSVESVSTAKVTVPTREDYVTGPLFMAAGIGELAPGVMVAFVEFDDLSGVILCKLEG